MKTAESNKDVKTFWLVTSFLHILSHPTPLLFQS